MPKMKLAPAIEYIPAIVRLTNHLQSPALTTSISFPNGNHSNFLNQPVRQAGAFFMRPLLNTYCFLLRLNIALQNLYLFDTFHLLFCLDAKKVTKKIKAS